MAPVRPSRPEVSAERAASSGGSSYRQPFVSRLASALLLLAALAAPWLAGAKTTLPDVRWWLGGTLAVAFLLVLVGRLVAGRLPAIPRAAVIPALFLLACLGWWSMQAEPRFATQFGAEHWAFLTANTPGKIFQWPRLERLAFLASVILGFLAAIDLGRREKFRRQLALAIGISGLAVGLYAHGFTWLGWPSLPWVLIDDGPEKFNICFYHYSGPPACLNLAWPLLVFGLVGWRGGLAWAVRILVVVVVGAALPIWDSAAGKSIAIGLLVVGVIWRKGATQGWLTPKRVAAALVAAALVVVVGQGVAISRMQTNTPDHWLSAEDSARFAVNRDARVRALAETRGDHLVVSVAPDRPASWLTALRMAADYPFIGLGPGAWVKRSALYTHDTVVSTFYHYRQFAHDDFLQLAAEWGGLAAVAVLVLWSGGIWRALHRQATQPTAEMGIVLALFGIALHSAVDFPLQIPALQLWTALLLGVAWSGTRAKPAASAT